jgi:MinD-like ATPase involved in chromosome partitioning or flagellar assembly
MNLNGSDDVSALCATIKFPSVTYKRFPRTRNRAPERMPDSERVVEFGSDPLAPDSHVSRHFSTQGNDMAQSGKTHWHELDAVLSAPMVQHERTPRTVPTPTIIVQSAAGGAGATTVAATISRLLMQNGNTVTLVDGHDTPTLQHFFKARAFRGGSCTLLDANDSSSGGIHLLAKGQGQGIDANNAQWFESEVSRLGDACDCIVWDGDGSRPIGRSMSGTDLDSRIVVLAPDIRSARALPRLEREFSERESISGARMQQLYVLNHFRSDVRLHVELAARFQDQLGSRFTVLPWSELVSEAAVHSQTVVDYAPNSSVAQNFMNLYSKLTALIHPLAAQSAAAAG